jgi:non-specific serine/threonine protein kinase
LIGEKISQYRVLREIAQGGMATVYEAEDTTLGRKVALKVIADDLLPDENAVTRFEREARAAALLDHPNICRVYELTHHHGRPVIVMELLQGETLRQMIRRGPLPVDQVLDLGIAVASALDAAHAKGIIHRDIKPGNIMLTDDGQVKLLDFGLAKSADPADDRAEADEEEGTIGGTTQFMSPEQTEGREIDPRSDLFSLGIVLYEAATGQRPFKRATALATMQAIRTIHPASLRAANPQIPEGLELIIAKLLEKDPAKRYQSAADLHSDLAALKSATYAPSAQRPSNQGLNAEALIPPIAAAEPPAVLETEERLVTRIWRRRAWYAAPFVAAGILFLILAAIVLYQHLAG